MLIGILWFNNGEGRVDKTEGEKGKVARLPLEQFSHAKQ